MERVSLNEHALEIQLADQLPQHRPLMVFAGGVASLADRRTEGGEVQRDLSNERGAPSGRGRDRNPQGFAVTHQLIEIGCAPMDLGDSPVTDRCAQRRHIHLLEEVAERGIRWRPPQLLAQRLGGHGVVADGKALQIPQALAGTQDFEHGHQKQIPGRETNPAPDPRIGNRPQVAD